VTALRAPLHHGATSATLSVLIVGAGAVGQVLGRHLARGGASVTFLVREKYAEETRRGFAMRPLNGGGRTSRRFDSFEVVTAVEEGARYDQVHLAIPSPIARGWLEPLARATPGATIVSYQPALDDRATILDAGVSEERLVAALVGFIAYAAPLEGEEPREPALAYWFPPLSPCLFSGARAESVVRALEAGDLPAKVHADVPRASAFPTAIMMAYLCALERAGWSLDALVGGSMLAAGAEAAREATAIVAAREGSPPLVARLLGSPLLFRVGLALARRIVPFPLEAYLRAHFTKVAAQTREIVRELVARGEATNLPMKALESFGSAP
jgi:2-dehydropantoate 2-reductase